MCFVIAMKEACWGFSHIRNAEQLGLDKRIIYTEALKGKGKLSSFTHTDEYKCTHEATLAQSSKWTTPRTHHCTIVHLSGLALYSERQWKDLTWHFKAYCCCQLSCHSQSTRALLSQGEFFGEVKGGCGGSVGLIWQSWIKTTTPLCACGLLFLVTAPCWKALSGEARPGQASALLHCQGQLNSGDVAQNRSVWGHCMDWWDMRKPCWGAQRAEWDKESVCCQTQYHTGAVAIDTNHFIPSKAIPLRL